MTYALRLKGQMNVVGRFASLKVYQLGPQSVVRSTLLG